MVQVERLALKPSDGLGSVDGVHYLPAVQLGRDQVFDGPIRIYAAEALQPDPAARFDLRRAVGEGQVDPRLHRLVERLHPVRGEKDDAAKVLELL